MNVYDGVYSMGYAWANGSRSTISSRATRRSRGASSSGLRTPRVAVSALGWFGRPGPGAATRWLGALLRALPRAAGSGAPRALVEVACAIGIALSRRPRPYMQHTHHRRSSPRNDARLWEGPRYWTRLHEMKPTPDGGVACIAVRRDGDPKHIKAQLTRPGVAKSRVASVLQASSHAFFASSSLHTRA